MRGGNGGEGGGTPRGGDYLRVTPEGTPLLGVGGEHETCKDPVGLSRG